MSPAAQVPAERAVRLQWSQMQELMRTHWLRRSDIPAEAAVSLPLPTLRFGGPGFQFHAGAMLRDPAGTIRREPPDCHWAFAAQGGRLLYYARSRAIPLEPAGAGWTAVSMDRPSLDVRALRERFQAFGPIMDQACERFFDGAPADFAADLLAELELLAGPPVMPFYRAMAPDFWQWLDGADDGPRA